nr:transposon TX1 uncharacterized [Tanacetum cinerariifolium]
FHGILNRKCRQNSIKGIMCDGVWVENPTPVESTFHSFYHKLFSDTKEIRPFSRNLLFQTLSIEQKHFLQAPFSRDDIKRAVWDSGSEKTPGPDGFTFGFIKRYWDFMADDIISLFQHFHHDPLIPIGRNPLFITLIPKVNDPKFVKDSRPISLIGCQDKIIGKILANRLAGVVSLVVGIEQLAFIKGCQILDGPLMLNEIVGWSKAKKEQLMLFKVDFEKTYDSLSWDYMFEVMGFMGFGDRWCSWIRDFYVLPRLQF